MGNPTYSALAAALDAVGELGTAAALDVPAAGNASSTEVVKGSDTRLSDARTATAHNHVVANIADFNSESRAQTEDMLVAGTNVTITPGGSGATRTLTINASGGGGGGFEIGQSVYAASEPATGTWALPGEQLSRATYTAASALFPDPVPCETLEPVTIPRGAFNWAAKNNGGNWAAATNYVAGEYSKANAVLHPGYSYRCTVGGTSGGTEPAGLTSNTTIGATFTDGGVTWTVEPVRYVVAVNSTTTGNCICISEDHGKTGYAVPAPAAITRIVFTGRRYIGVSGANQLHFSDDGDSWVKARPNTSGVWNSIATDGKGKVIVLASVTSQGLTSVNHGDTFQALTQTNVVTSALSACYTGVSGYEFAYVNSGQFVTMNGATFTQTSRQPGIGGNLYLGSDRLISHNGGSTNPSYLALSNLTAAWTACTALPAAAKAIFYSDNYAGWYALSNSNAGTALYSSPDGVTAWTTTTLTAYGIGSMGLDTGDGKFLIVGTNTTAASTNSNIRRLLTATTEGDFMGIPQVGSTSFVFGDSGGICYAFNTGGTSAAQGLKFDTAIGLWKTLPHWSGFNSASGVFDLGSGVTVFGKGAIGPGWSSDGFETSATAPVAATASLSKNTDGSITYFFDGTPSLLKNVNRLSGGSLVPSVGSTNTATLGFTLTSLSSAVYEPTAGKHYFPGKGINGSAAVYWIDDAGTSDGVIETSLGNAQFDYLAFDGTQILAVSKSTHAVWVMPVGGSFGPVGTLPTNNGLWVDLQWCPTLNRFAIYNTSAVTVGREPIWLSKDGREWRGYGNAVVAIGHGYWSEVAQRFFLAATAQLNTPIMQEMRTVDNDTHFVIEAPEGGAPSNQAYYMRIL